MAVKIPVICGTWLSDWYLDILADSRLNYDDIEKFLLKEYGARIRQSEITDQAYMYLIIPEEMYTLLYLKHYQDLQ